MQPEELYDSLARRLPEGSRFITGPGSPSGSQQWAAGEGPPTLGHAASQLALPRRSQLAPKQSGASSGDFSFYRRKSSTRADAVAYQPEAQHVDPTQQQAPSDRPARQRSPLEANGAPQNSGSHSAAGRHPSTISTPVQVSPTPSVVYEQPGATPQLLRAASASLRAAQTDRQAAHGQPVSPHGPRQASPSRAVGRSVSAYYTQPATDMSVAGGPSLARSRTRVSRPAVSQAERQDILRSSAAQTASATSPRSPRPSKGPQSFAAAAHAARVAARAASAGAARSPRGSPSPTAPTRPAGPHGTYASQAAGAPVLSPRTGRSPSAPSYAAARRVRADSPPAAKSPAAARHAQKVSGMAPGGGSPQRLKSVAAQRHSLASVAGAAMQAKSWAARARMNRDNAARSVSPMSPGRNRTSQQQSPAKPGASAAKRPVNRAETMHNPETRKLQAPRFQSVQERHHYDADSDSSHESSHSSHSHSHSLTSTQVSQSLTSTARRSSQDDDRGTHEQGTAQPHTTAAQGANGEAAAAAGFAVAGGVGGATMPPRIKKRVSISVGDPALPQGQARGPSTGGAPTADPFASASVQQGILRSMRQRQQGDTGVAASAAQAPQPAAGAASAAAAAAVADPPPGATARRFTVVASPVQRSTERIHGYAGPKPAHPSRLGAVQRSLYQDGPAPIEISMTEVRPLLAVSPLRASARDIVSGDVDASTLRGSSPTRHTSTGMVPGGKRMVPEPHTGYRIPTARIPRYVPGVGFVDEHVGGTSSAATGFQTGDILMAGLPPLSATVPTQHEQVDKTAGGGQQHTTDTLPAASTGPILGSPGVASPAPLNPLELVQQAAALLSAAMGVLPTSAIPDTSLTSATAAAAAAAAGSAAAAATQRSAAPKQPAQPGPSISPAASDTKARTDQQSQHSSGTAQLPSQKRKTGAGVESASQAPADTQGQTRSPEGTDKQTKGAGNGGGSGDDLASDVPSEDTEDERHQIRDASPLLAWDQNRLEAAAAVLAEHGKQSVRVLHHNTGVSGPRLLRTADITPAEAQLGTQSGTGENSTTSPATAAQQAVSAGHATHEIMAGSHARSDSAGRVKGRGRGRSGKGLQGAAKGAPGSSDVPPKKGAKKGKAMDTVTLDATGTYRIGIAIASDTSTLTDTQARAEAGAGASSLLQESAGAGVYVDSVRAMKPQALNAKDQESKGTVLRSLVRLQPKMAIAAPSDKPQLVRVQQGRPVSDPDAIQVGTTSSSNSQGMAQGPLTGGVQGTLDRTEVLLGSLAARGVGTGGYVGAVPMHMAYGSALPVGLHDQTMVMDGPQQGYVEGYEDYAPSAPPLPSLMTTHTGLMGLPQLQGLSALTALSSLNKLAALGQAGLFTAEDEASRWPVLAETTPPGLHQTSPHTQTHPVPRYPDPALIPLLSMTHPKVVLDYLPYASVQDQLPAAQGAVGLGLAHPSPLMATADEGGTWPHFLQQCAAMPPQAEAAPPASAAPWSVSSQGIEPPQHHTSDTYYPSFSSARVRPDTASDDPQLSHKEDMILLERGAITSTQGHTGALGSSTEVVKGDGTAAQPPQPAAAAAPAAAVRASQEQSPLSLTFAADIPQPAVAAVGDAASGVDPRDAQQGLPSELLLPPSRPFNAPQPQADKAAPSHTSQDPQQATVLVPAGTEKQGSAGLGDAASPSMQGAGQAQASEPASALVSASDATQQEHGCEAQVDADAQPETASSHLLEQMTLYASQAHTSSAVAAPSDSTSDICTGHELASTEQQPVGQGIAGPVGGLGQVEAPSAAVPVSTPSPALAVASLLNSSLIEERARETVQQWRASRAKAAADQRAQAAAAVAATVVSADTAATAADAASDADHEPAQLPAASTVAGPSVAPIAGHQVANQGPQDLQRDLMIALLSAMPDRRQPISSQGILDPHTAHTAHATAATSKADQAGNASNAHEPAVAKAPVAGHAEPVVAVAGGHGTAAHEPIPAAAHNVTSDGGGVGNTEPHSAPVHHALGPATTLTAPHPAPSSTATREQSTTSSSTQDAALASELYQLILTAMADTETDGTAQAAALSQAAVAAAAGGLGPGSGSGVTAGRLGVSVAADMGGLSAAPVQRGPDDPVSQQGAFLTDTYWSGSRGAASMQRWDSAGRGAAGVAGGVQRVGFVSTVDMAGGDAPGVSVLPNPSVPRGTGHNFLQVLNIIPVESPQQPWSPAPTSPRAADQSQLHVQQLRERMAQQLTSQVDIPSAAQPVAASQYQPTQPSQPQVVHVAARVPKLWTAPVQQASGGRGVGPGAAHTTQTFSAQAPVGSQTTLPTVSNAQGESAGPPAAAEYVSVEDRRRRAELTAWTAEIRDMQAAIDRAEIAKQVAVRATQQAAAARVAVRQAELNDIVSMLADMRRVADDVEAETRDTADMMQGLSAEAELSAARQYNALMIEARGLRQQVEDLLSNDDKPDDIRER